MNPTRNGFQSFVNAQPAPGQPGDFASTNPRMSSIAGANGFQAAVGGVVVGLFAWGNPASGLLSNYFQAESVLGFVHRENQAQITDYLGMDSLVIPAGYPAYSMSRGDFLALFLAGATPGQTVYANALTGVATAGAAGVGVDFTFTASIVASTKVMTVTVIASPDLAAGQVVTGASVPAGTYIVSQLTGSAGDTGTYQLGTLGDAFAGNVGSGTLHAYETIETAYKVASEVKPDVSFTASLADSGVLTVTAVASGEFEVGQFVNSTGMPVNAQIVAFISGTGDTGTYQLNFGDTLTSRAMTATQGQVGKISTWQ